MAFKKSNKKATESKREYLDLSQFTVTNVRVVTDTLVTFTMKGTGISLYGMRLIDGKNGMFVAPPQQKGKDGNYYNLYAVYISEDDLDGLFNSIMKQIDGDDDFASVKNGDELPFN